MPATKEQALASLEYLRDSMEKLPEMFDAKPAKIIQHSLMGGFLFHLQVIEEAVNYRIRTKYGKRKE